MPNVGDINSNKDISIVGIYYSDSNSNIYIGRTKNYTDIDKYEYNAENKEGKLYWKWEDTNTKYGDTDTGEDEFVLNKNIYYTYTTTTDIEEEETITEYGVIKIKNSYDIIKQIEVIFNRLPKTFKKSNTAFRTLYNDSKVIMRVNNLLNPTQSLNSTVISTTQTGNSVQRSTTQSNNANINSVGGNSLINKNVLQQSLLKANKIAARSAVDVKAVKTASINNIEPKIQAAYGFTDYGKVKNLNVDGYLSMDDGSYVTTHKIGYEESDRYRNGTMSCDSYLFLSPLNHSEIQVNGDTNKSNISIKSNESLRVPIIYQYRMEDYKGNIFGEEGYKSTDIIVNNTKYANIIGIDIWLNTLSDTPKQYDIVVYSTYNKDNARATGSVVNKISENMMQVNIQSQAMDNSVSK